MCDVGAVSNTDTFIKQGPTTPRRRPAGAGGALKNVNYFIDGCNDPKYCTVEAETRDNYLGIARWFRAWFYYDKLTTYGEVPWFPNDIQSYQNDVMYKDRDSRDVIIRNLIADLDFAYEHIRPPRRPAARRSRAGPPPRSSRASASSKRLTAVTTTSRGLRSNPRGAVSRGRQGRQAGDRQQRLLAQHRRGQEGAPIAICFTARRR